MEEIKEEYIKPTIHVIHVADLMDDTTLPVSNHTGDTGTGALAKPFDFEDDEEDMEMNKWGTTLPTNVPDAWKQVGE